MKRVMILVTVTVACSFLVACSSDGGGRGGGGTSGSSDSGSGSGSTDSGSGSGSALATGEGPCEAASDCNGGVCVALIDGNNPPIYCSEQCGQCPSGFYCDSQTFGLVGLEFCRFGQTEPAEVTPPSEPPRLPCRSDADCEAPTVCATYGGVRDCTIPCDTEGDCTPPSLGGVTLDLATCAPDETEGQSRTVCLPDAACFPNAMSCIGGFPGLP